MRRGSRPPSAARAVAPNPQAEALQIHVLPFVGLAGPTALQAHAQDAPDAGRPAGVVVAVSVGVPLQEPAPAAAFAGRVGILLPALEYTGQGLQRRAPCLWISHMDTPLVEGLLDLDARQ